VFWKFPLSTTKTLRFSACFGKQAELPKNFSFLRCFFVDGQRTAQRTGIFSAKPRPPVNQRSKYACILHCDRF
jgi:hypothetical protein